MKIYKRYLVGFSILSGLIALGLSIIPTHKALAATDYQWDTHQIQSISTGATFKLVASSGNMGYGEAANNRCGYDKFILLNSPNGNSGQYFEMRERSIAGGHVEQGGNAPPNLAKYLNPQGYCFITNGPDDITISGKYGVAAPASSAKAGDACSGGADCINGSCTKDGGRCVVPDTGETACESNSGGTPMTWLICPVLDAATSMTTALEGLFEDQLSFNVNQLGSGQAKVHQSWALIRDISTGMVVIIALIMIISQAASFGPFDAYTVRKMLPRIIAAVILIQISWVGVVWTISLVDAAARGIADLMYYPFNGPDNMGLFALLKNAGLGTFELATFNWAAIGIGAFLGVAFLFTMLGFALSAVLALLVALIVLIFRKMLIILLLIFAPLALLAWILPGTERYWKMWRENLMKVLFMFPIAVAIIAAGRIFAYVVGAQPGNGGDLLALVFVLVGFFGPLFILPKTFKWGGQAMGLAGGAINNVGQKAGAPGKKFLGTRQEGWSAERRRQSQERYARGEKFNPKRPWQRPIDLLRSGQLDPTQGLGRISLRIPGTNKTITKNTSRRREQAMTGYAAKGAESEDADIKLATQRADVMFSQALDHDELARALARGGWDDNGKIYERKNTAGQIVKLDHVDEAMQVAGLNAVAKYGGDKNFHFIDKTLTDMRAVDSSGNPTNGKQYAAAKKFLDTNASTFLPKMKHFYYGDNRDESIAGSIGSMNASSFSGMEAAEAQAIVQSLTKRIAAGGTDGVAAGSQLRTVLTHYNAAITNENTKASVGTGVNKAFEALIDGGNLAEINGNRTSRGLAAIELPHVTRSRLNPDVAAAITDLGLSGKIDPRSGNVNP